MEPKKTGLELLRDPFPENQISKLPKGTKQQNECPASEKVNCKICGGWHHPRVIHLDYVGHAALTDRLLDADPNWTWEPVAFNKDTGLPQFDESGGLWIKLTVCGHSRYGYGHATLSQFKEIGSREKEVIGDALRNAAMRFGAALELWHKGELHIEEKPEENIKTDAQKYEELPENTKSRFEKLGLTIDRRLAGCIKYKWDISVMNTELDKLITAKEHINNQKEPELTEAEKEFLK